MSDAAATPIKIPGNPPEGNFYYGSYLSTKAGIKRVTFWRWQKKGLIPLARYCDFYGRGLFTFEQMETFVFAVRDKRKGRISKQEMFERINAGW